MVESKFSTNVRLALWPTALGVPAAVGHGVRGAANGRQYWPVGPGPDAVGHGVRTLTSWAAAVVPTYIRSRAPGAGPFTPPSLLPPNIRLSTLQSTCEVEYVSKFSSV
jgi:hypothetical protein